MSVVQQYVEELDTLLGPHEKATDAPFNAEQTQTAIEEGTELLDQLKIEVHTITNPAEKREVQAKMLKYKDTIGRLQKQLLTNGRSGAAIAPTTAGNSQQRGQESLDILAQARRQLAETEATAVDTMEHLTKQREQIQKATDNTKKVNADLGYSNKLLGKMGQWFRG